MTGGHERCSGRVCRAWAFKHIIRGAALGLLLTLLMFVPIHFLTKDILSGVRTTRILDVNGTAIGHGFRNPGAVIVNVGQLQVSQGPIDDEMKAPQWVRLPPQGWTASSTMRMGLPMPWLTSWMHVDHGPPLRMTNWSFPAIEWWNLLADVVTLGLIAEVSIALAIVWNRSLRRRRRQCVICQYDLRGSAAGSACPECGHFYQTIWKPLP